MSENNISCLFGMLIKYGTTSTKTLAKIASKLAKRCPRLDGCCCKQDIEKVLTIFPVSYTHLTLPTIYSV